MKKYRIWLLCLLIFLTGVFVRVYKLGNVPNSLNWDEVSWGYNAFSIEKTGRDEYGTFMPLSFRAFGDYKQPVYVYATAVSITLFGLTPFSTRLPSAVFGSISILFLFFLIRELFWEEKRRDIYALVGMALFALSPWSIQFSRVAYEANVALCFIIAGFYLFFYGLHRKKIGYFFIAAAVLALSTYTYHSEKILTPLLFGVLFLFSCKYFWKNKKQAIGLLLFFGLCCSIWLIDTRTTARGRSVLFFSEPSKVLERSIEKIDYEKTQHMPLASVIHNRRLLYIHYFAANYLSHFNPEYLFLTGDQPQHHAPNMGLLYLISLPFILLGIYLLLRNGFSEQWFLFAWFLIAPLASSLAIDAPNASRNLIMAPTWDIFAAYGLVSFVYYFIRKRWAVILFVPLFLLVVGNTIFYFHQYFVHTNKEVGKYWQYGYKEAILDALTKNDGSRHIFIANDIEQGYAFYLFYTKYDPVKYQAIAKNQVGYDCRIIDNLIFGDCKVLPQSGDILVTSNEPSVKTLHQLQRINYLNGERAVAIYEYE